LFGTEANMKKLDGIYGMLLIPTRNINETDRSDVFKILVSKMYSKITWIDEWVSTFNICLINYVFNLPL
jgi:hypothetical protein